MKQQKLIIRVTSYIITIAFLIAPFTVIRPIPANATPVVYTPTVDQVFRDHTLSADQRIESILNQLTLEETIGVALNQAVPRLGLNAGKSGSGEGLHGVQVNANANTPPATVFPSSIGLSQTWDKDLLHKIGEIIAEEGLANNGGNGRLTPVLDLLRDPRYGRAYETYGEDAFLTGTLGTAMTQGMNQRDENGYQQFIPILKHPLAYNNEINRLWTNSSITPRNINEYYIKAFKYPISDGSAKSFMNSYPVINGKPMSVHPLQYDMLYAWTPDYDDTGHYEFKTINDYGSGSSMWVHSQRYFEDNPMGRAFGLAQGTKNGQMSWSFRSYGNSTTQLYDAIARGMLTKEDIMDNARRMLTMNLRMGDYDHLEIQNPYLEKLNVSRTDLLDENRAEALRASQEQIVLLKNDDNILPLKGSDTTKAVLLGFMTDAVLKDHYTGSFPYYIPIKAAFENKLGKDNIYADDAVDTIAIKAPNGKYLVNADNQTYRNSGSSNAADTPVSATGDVTNVTMADEDVKYRFEWIDIGSTIDLLRTPINNKFVQVPHVTSTSPAEHRGVLINNTNLPGQENYSGGTSYVTYQTFRIVPTDDGKYGLYNVIAGNGINNEEGRGGMAYDQDDEDMNNGSFMRLNDGSDAIKADTANAGPYRAENHVDGPSITQAPFDTNGDDNVVDSLPNNYKFDIEVLQSSEEAVDSTLASAGEDAPVFLVVGYDPWINAREAVDLQNTGLSEQQMRVINHITDPNGLNRELILIVRTGSPMTIDASVHNNPNVKAIVEIGHSGQEEGSALVSALFDDGYSVPEVNWEPTKSWYQYPTAPYEEYPGLLTEGRTIPAYAPAGRLTATWYKEIADMKGASEDHPPQSYRYPAYDEEKNDNLSNLHGTINTGLLTYDIIKGERTYQYLNKAPLYEFGYGLTYTDFEYESLTVSAVSNGKFTVSGIVKNTGNVTSDEVVQIYSRFDGTPSRIVQPNAKLIAYDRLLQIKPGESRAFQFNVDLTDMLGVWDVEINDYIVEPGNYIIRAAKSALDEGKTAKLTVTTSNGGTAAASRNLNRLMLAENFDDYSNVGGRIDDIEFISASSDFHSNTAVQFRKDGAWINFKNVRIPADTGVLTLQAASDRIGNLQVYALPAGTVNPNFAGATPIATFELMDTRSVSGLPTGLGIGPVAIDRSEGYPFSFPYPGSIQGQNGIDPNTGSAYKDAYVKPEWVKLSANINLAAGNYDIYIVTQNRNSRIEWLKFGGTVDHTDEISVSQMYSQNSIREKDGELALRADLTPITSVDAVTWSLQPTNLATIDAKGLLKATGSGNGTVTVTATSGGKSATYPVLITNQLDSNKVSGTTRGTSPTPITEPKTVDFILLMTGNNQGPNDNIQRYKGTNQQVAVFSELFSENDVGYYLANTNNYLRIPVSELSWVVTDLDGGDTDLATVDDAGLVTATGEGDGDVLVTATLKNNPDIVGTRIIRIQNQGAKNPYKMIQAENYDNSTTVLTANTTFGANVAAGITGNETGLYITAAADSVLNYSNVDFSKRNPTEFYIRMAPEANTATTVTVDIWIDEVGDNGTKVGTLTETTGAYNIIYDTYSTVVEDIEGIHDVYLTFSAPVRFNWFAFKGEGEKFEVLFDSLDGTEVETQYVTEGTPITKPNDPQKEGARFGGWYENADYSGEAWNFDTDVVAKDITLYAKWVYTVNFETNGGSAVPSQEIVHGKKIAPVASSRSGYRFDGWFQTQSFTGDAWDFTKDTVTSSMTLYAKWTYDDIPITDYTVTFNSQGGSAVSSSTVISGGKVIKPNDPVRDGYLFRGWYTDEACQNAYDFDKTVTSSFTLYAKWIKDYYDDITGHWAKEDILSMTENGLFNGTGYRKFEPDANLNRAMFITLLWRVAGETVSNTKHNFIDVEAGSWYAAAVAWGVETGVTKGTSATEFSPYVDITREMMATMMYRYAQEFNLDQTANGDLSKFVDANLVSPWVGDGMKWAVGHEIIQGKPNNLLDPRGLATRAEAATVIARFLPLT